MTAPAEITERRAKILDHWQRAIFASYPGPARKSFQGGRDRFHNPVGDMIRRGTAAVLDGLLADRPPPDLAGDLDGIVRLRAVQDFRPSEAVAFVFDLKAAARAELPAADSAIAWLDERVDALALVAFDLFDACREKIREIRLSEAKARLGQRLERADRIVRSAEH